MNYSDKLRELAAWLDNHPMFLDELAGTFDYPTVTVWVNKEDFSRFARAMGSFKKTAYSGTINAKKDVTDDEGTIFTVGVTLPGACERKVKLDDDGKPVTQIIPEHTQVEYEYSCPESFLNL